MGWHTPEWLTRSLSLVGQMAIPLMLITLGVAIRAADAGAAGPGGVVVGSRNWRWGWRRAWRPGAGFGLEPMAFGVLVLQMATPVARDLLPAGRAL